MSMTARPAAVAGMFYPADARALAAQVDELLDEAMPRATAHAPKLLVVPHAGYVYSGAVAAHAYALLAPWRERIDRVVLLGPTHRVAVRGIAVPTVSAFDTPIGRVRLDTETLARLCELSQVTANDRAHAQEHSLEVQLPFLQRALGTFTLLPFAVGDASAAEVAEVLELVWGGDETLIVISTDLSHYLPYAEAREKDRATVERILRQDPRLDHREACGATPLGGALLAARAHGLAPRLLDLRNSGDTAGDRSRVVGYCALAFEARDSSAGDAAETRSQAAEQASAAQGAALGTALISRARATRSRPRSACRSPTSPGIPHWRRRAPPSSRCAGTASCAAASARSPPSARSPTTCAPTRWRRRFATPGSSR